MILGYEFIGKVDYWGPEGGFLLRRGRRNDGGNGRDCDYWNLLRQVHPTLPRRHLEPDPSSGEWSPIRASNLLVRITIVTLKRDFSSEESSK